MGAAWDIPCQFSRAWDWGRALAQPRICNNIAVLPASVRSSADCAGQRPLKRRHWLQTVAADAAVRTMKTSVTFSPTYHLLRMRRRASRSTATLLLTAPTSQPKHPPNNIAVLPASVRSSADCAGQRQLKRRHWLQTVAADAAVSTMKTSVTFSTTYHWLRMRGAASRCTA